MPCEIAVAVKEAEKAEKSVKRLAPQDIVFFANLASDAQKHNEHLRARTHTILKPRSPNSYRAPRSITSRAPIAATFQDSFEHRYPTSTLTTTRRTNVQVTDRQTDPDSLIERSRPTQRMRTANTSQYIRNQATKNPQGTDGASSQIKIM